MKYICVCVSRKRITSCDSAICCEVRTTRCFLVHARLLSIVSDNRRVGHRNSASSNLRSSRLLSLFFSFSSHRVRRLDEFPPSEQLADTPSGAYVHENTRASRCMCLETRKTEVRNENYSNGKNNRFYIEISKSQNPPVFSFQARHHFNFWTKIVHRSDEIEHSFSSKSDSCSIFGEKTFPASTTT